MQNAECRNLRRHHHRLASHFSFFIPHSSFEERGSALIIVLWVCLGLVAIALSFAGAMSHEARAADNRLAATQARLALDGAARYASNVLANVRTPGQLDFNVELRAENVPVGEAHLWFIGRTNDTPDPDEPAFQFADESTKLNLNTATAAMLEWLPGMTPEIAAAIVDWRDADSTPGNGGAENETYQRLNPPYRCKNARFESVDELRLVNGMTLEILYGEDANLNGALDPNENDGDDSPPADDRSGTLDAGVWEYVTVWSREPVNTRTNVNNPQALAVVLQDALGTQRANQILSRLAPQPGRPRTTFTSLLEFYLASSMTKDEFDQVGDVLVATTNTTGYIEGLVNLNTASETVLACLPGIGINAASSVAAYRRANAGNLRSVAWLLDALGGDRNAALQAAPYVTTHSYQVAADAAAVGRHGRGYQRVRYIYDLSDGAPRVAWRQDLSHLGWALGKNAFLERELANNNRP